MKYFLLSILLLISKIGIAQSSKNPASDFLKGRPVFYEVNVRQFSKEGSIKAVEKQLPRLKAMGVDVVWFMPIHPIGKKNRKGSLGSYYSISNYKEVNPEFGSLADFKDVVNAAHALGIKVIIDWVANHTSWDNPWIKQHPEFYALDSNKKKYSPFDWSDVVQLNHKNKGQQAAMRDAMQYWVSECNIDGFRCDVAHMVPLDFWVNARKSIDPNKSLIWLAETQDTEYFKAFDIIYGWEWLHKMEDYHKGNTTVQGLDRVISLYNKDAAKGKYRLLFTTNHDENSWNGTEQERLGKHANSFLKICSELNGVLLLYNGQEEPLNKRLKFFEKDAIGFKQYSNEKWVSTLIANRKKSKPKTKDLVKYFTLTLK